MLRSVVVLLLLANLLFFSWTRGWFGDAVPAPRHGEHEPARLSAQVRPEAVILLSPPAASAAVSAAREAAQDAVAVCLEAGPFDDAELPAAEAALTAAQLTAGSLARAPAAPPPLWLVATARIADAAVRRAREEDLRKLQLAVQTLSAASAPGDVAPALVVSRHASKADAEAALAALLTASPAPRGLRVVGLPAPALRRLLRVARADAGQQARLLALPASPALAGGFRPCAPPS